MEEFEKENSKQAKKKGRIVRRVLLYFVLLVFLSAIGFAGWFYFKYGRELLELRAVAQSYVASSDKETFRACETSMCYYADGTLMQELKGVKEVYYLEYEDIPAYAIKALLAVEDRKFFDHKGYDIYAIARAARAYIQNDGEIRQGGSTITQQLARGTFLTNEKTIERKVTEIFTAAALEKKYSKNDILEFYINNIYFANGFYGLQAAADGYFGKTAASLTLSQLAFLCGIPNSPSAYDPYVNFGKALERRDSVLSQMYEVGYISKSEYDGALGEEIILVNKTTERNNYEETYTYDCAVRALMAAEGFAFRSEFDSEEDHELYEAAFSEEYSTIKSGLYTRGYRIYTSINRTKQQLLQEAVDTALSEYTETNEEGIYSLQASGVCIDNETGLVVAVIGGRSQEYNGYTLNRAYQSARQPGSAIKPLIVYTPAFERGYYPDTTVVDEKFEGGPRNSENVYSGEIELRYAISVSKNTVAWKLFDETGIERGLSYLEKMNFSHLCDRDYVPAAALGGLTYGATAVEMASGYATLANGGIYRTPTCILRITDSDGTVLVDNSLSATPGTSTVTSSRIYDKNATLMMTDCLKTVMESGTGRRLKLENVTSAGKTGTTTDQKDGWFAGYTGYYSTAVWVGYDLPRAMEELRGNTLPGVIWNCFMESIHEGLEDRTFEEYDDPRPAPEEDEITEDIQTISEGEEASEDGQTIPEGEEIGEDVQTVTEASIEFEEDGIGDEGDGIVWVTPGTVTDDPIVWVSP